MGASWMWRCPECVWRAQEVEQDCPLEIWISETRLVSGKCLCCVRESATDNKYLRIFDEASLSVTHGHQRLLINQDSLSLQSSHRIFTEEMKIKYKPFHFFATESGDFWERSERWGDMALPTKRQNQIQPNKKMGKGPTTRQRQSWRLLSCDLWGTDFNYELLLWSTIPDNGDLTSDTEQHS